MKYHIDFDLDLRRNEGNGLYIALEGTEASGKTTQVEELKKYFESKGREVVTTREPRKEGFVGSLIHKVLKGEMKISPTGLQYLMAADRAFNQEEIIIPALEKGYIVVSDRSFWSAIVYGILDKGGEYSEKSVDRPLVAQSILSMYHQFIVPDFTFYLRVPLDISLERLKNERKQVKEIYEVDAKIKKVIEGYDFLLSHFPNEITVIDGTKSIEEVTEEILAKISSIKY